MKWTTPLKFVKEEIIGSENTFLAWCLLIAVTLIVSMGLYLSSPSATFQGIAGSRESYLNFETPVEIKQVLVIPGQRVKRGDLLIELNQRELDQSIRGLQAALRKLKAELFMRDQMNHAAGNALKPGELDPLTVALRDQEEELKFLEHRRNQLFVFADIDGIVGSVNFQKGETVPAFQSIVTIAPESPSYVQGFIYEKLRSGVKMGSVVRIGSSTNEAVSVTGRIVSLGSRFVEIPLRIAQSNGLALWGREVIVEIPQASGLLLNERVTISPVTSWLPSFIAHAALEREPERSVAEPTPIRVPHDLKGRSLVGVSGAVYLRDLQKYLVAAGEFDSKDAPTLYLVGADGDVDQKSFALSQMTAIEQVEALSVDGGTLYVLGRYKNQINLISLQRRGVELFDVKTLDLQTLLKREMFRSRVPEFKEWASQPSQFEIDSFVVHHGVFYFGIRRQQTALIVKIHPLDHLFETQKVLKTELWKTIDLAQEPEGASRLRGFSFIGERFYFLTSTRRDGTLWSLDASESPIVKIRTFEHDSPQGIAFDPTNGQLFVTFSANNSSSKFLAVSAFSPGTL